MIRTASDVPNPLQIDHQRGKERAGHQGRCRRLCGGPALKRKGARFITACGVGKSLLRDGLLWKNFFWGAYRALDNNQNPTASSGRNCQPAWQKLRKKGRKNPKGLRD
jgi:hypothetical protein